MKFKKTFAVLALIPLAVFALAGAIKVTVDGDPVAFTGQGPQEVKGHVLVPLRGVLEKMGATVEYDVSSQTATATRGEKTIEITIGKAFARINNNDTPLDSPAMIIHDTTMVPLRFVGQALGAKVTWDAATQTVILTTRGE